MKIKIYCYCALKKVFVLLSIFNLGIYTFPKGTLGHECWLKTYCLKNIELVNLFIN